MSRSFPQDIHKSFCDFGFWCGNKRTLFCYNEIRIKNFQRSLPIFHWKTKFNFLIRKMIDGNLNEVISPVEIDFTFKTKLVSANEFPSFRFRRTIFLKRKLTLSIPAFFPLYLATSALNPVMKNKNILTHYLRKEI